MAKVPIELLDAFASMTPGTMSREEAFRIREELMKERSVDLEFGNGMFTHVSGQWLGAVDCVLTSRFLQGIQHVVCVVSSQTRPVTECVHSEH